MLARSKKQPSYLLFFFILPICSSLWSTINVPDQSYIHVAFYSEQDDEQACEDKITSQFPSSFILTDITYEADVCLQQSEFFYLVCLYPGDCITHKKLSDALFYLSKKQKFESIAITAKKDNTGYKLHFTFHSFWTFQQLKFRGIFVGKEHYRQFYIMEYGNRFDIKKHKDSLEKIKDSLKREGYFCASVKDHFDYSYKTKSVTVYLDLRKKSRFSIGTVKISLKTHDGNARSTELLRRAIQNIFVQKLTKNYYSRELINNQTKELEIYLAKKGYFHTDIELDEHVHYKTKRVHLHFTIHLRDKKKIFFTGNRFFSRAQLLEYVLVFGRSTSLLPASILAEELIKAYHNKGFWCVTVDSKEENEAYYFCIDEGSQARITQIELRNLPSFNERVLIKKFFLPVLKKTFYDNAVFEHCVQALLTYLLKQGFWQASLLQHSFERIENDQYKLILVFDEGSQSFLKKVTIEGFECLASKGPFKQFNKQKKPIPFAISIIEEQRQWLMEYFYKEGYYQAKIKPIYTKQNSDISLTWKIDLNDAQIQFGKTVLLGSTTFPFSFVQRELDYKIGDPWHNDTLRHSISRLKKLEIFESIHLFPDKSTTDTAEKIMLLKLQKDDPYELKMRTGLGVQHVTKSLTTGGLTYRVGGSFIFKNPTNAGDQFRIDADFTRAIRLVNAQYRRPWLFNVPIHGLFKGYTNRFEYPGFIGSQKNLYTVIQQGFLVNLTSVYNMIDAALSSGFEVVDTFIDESTQDQAIFAQKVARAINFRPDLLDKNIPFFLVQPTLIIFYLDSTINPTKGSFSVLSAKGMFPMAKLAPNNFFIRILAEQSFFVPIMPFVFAIRFRMGHIFHPKFSTIIPIERFYLGGANSIRSYETDQCPPLGVVCDENNKELFVPQGGRSLVNLNLELRFPLYKQLGGVIFGDIGALSTNRLADIKAEDLLSGIGFGLRYNTPIGPLRFDFAWRVHKRDGVGRPYAWFLSFGNAFI